MTTKSEKRDQKHLLEAKNDEKRTFWPLFSLLVVIKNAKCEQINSKFNKLAFK